MKYVFYFLKTHTHRPTNVLYFSIRRHQ